MMIAERYIDNDDGLLPANVANILKNSNLSSFFRNI